MDEVFKYHDRDMSNDIERLEQLQEELANIINSMRGRDYSSVVDDDAQNIKEDLSDFNVIANKGRYKRRKHTKKGAFVSGTKMQSVVENEE